MYGFGNEACGYIIVHFSYLSSLFWILLCPAWLRRTSFRFWIKGFRLYTGGMKVIRTPEEMLAWSREQRASGKTIGLVPTMGYLHEGHLSLVHTSREQSDVTVVSLFVNPTQFGPSEDLDKYPRNEERDQALCEEAGVNALFAPDASAMYAEDRSVRVVEESLFNGLCGASRPGHFDGVCTIVAKLFNVVDPDLAVFGEKDAQQLRIIRRMVRDLNFCVRIVSGPIVRESDGLAMSSRNSLLSDEEREQATALYASLLKAQAAFAAGETEAGALTSIVSEALRAATLGKIDYIACVDDETLRPVDKIDRKALLAIAVNFSSTRLIDNVVLGG